MNKNFINFWPSYCRFLYFYKTLEEGFKLPVGMGGTFLQVAGEVKYHVMPDFSPCPLDSDEKVSQWLRFYTFGAPFVNMATFISKDPGNVSIYRVFCSFLPHRALPLKWVSIRSHLFFWMGNFFSQTRSYSFPSSDTRGV